MSERMCLKLHRLLRMTKQAIQCQVDRQGRQTKFESYHTPPTYFDCNDPPFKWRTVEFTAFHRNIAMSGSLTGQKQSTYLHPCQRTQFVTCSSFETQCCQYQFDPRQVPQKSNRRSRGRFSAEQCSYDSATTATEKTSGQWCSP